MRTRENWSYWRSIQIGFWLRPTFLEVDTVSFIFLGAKHDLTHECHLNICHRDPGQYDRNIFELILLQDVQILCQFRIILGFPI